MNVWLIAVGILCLTACSGGSSTIPTNSTSTIAAPITTIDDEVRPYTPGADAQPAVAIAPPLRALTSDEIAHEAIMSAQLGDPTRTSRRPRNTVANWEEYVGTFTPYIPHEQGQVVNIGVQLNYEVKNGGNFYHTHSGLCFEYGINYSGTAPTLFGYNWCATGNLPQGFMNIGLVGYPNGLLNTWSSSGNGWLLAWDSTMGTYKISLEEILESNGWHLLGYNWGTTKFVDIMNNFGVTGTIANWGGDDIFEEHVTGGTSCNFDSGSVPIGSHLLYDLKKQVMLNGQWEALDHISGVYGVTQIDCADISGLSHPGYTSPYFSGEYYQSSVAGPYGQTHAGDWWMTQR
jgi:hypothetical protein